MKLKYIEKLFKKLLLSPKYLIYAFAGKRQRDKKIWVFGTYNKGFSDNSKYLFLHIHNNVSNIRAIWISRDRRISDFLTNLGYEAYFKESKKGKYFLSKAYYHFTNTNLVDTSFWYSKGAKYFNLWHGIPLKKIEFDITTGSNAWKYNSSNKISAFIKKICFPALYRRPDYLLSSSKLISEKMKSAFRVSDKELQYFSYPRNSVNNKSKKDLRSLIAKFESEKEVKVFDNIANFKKTVAYLPTFRDGSKNFIEKAGIDFEKWNKFLKDRNWLLLVKFHPNVKLEIKEYTNINFLKSKVDIYPFFSSIDCLITDYSSIYLDYLLLDREIIFFSFDKEEYLNKTRGIYFDYDSIVPGNICDSFTNLLGEMDNYDNANNAGKRKEITQEFWGESLSKSIDDFSEFLVKETQK